MYALLNAISLATSAEYARHLKKGQITDSISLSCIYCVDLIPANGHCHGLRRGGTGTHHLGLQSMGLKHVQEGITGRHRPWMTKNSTYWCFLKFRLTELVFLAYSQGLAPSVTISIRNEARLVSLWSRWAIIAQCKSRHFTKATRAAWG